jgi:hypothetical protein
VRLIAKLSPKKIITRLQRSFDHNFYPIFICGVAGSGTTLLSGLLDQRYQNAGCIHESALAMPSGSALRINSVGSYQALACYYSSMFIANDVPDQAVRASMLKLYRRVAHYPKHSSIIIDKAPNVHLVRTRRLRAAFPRSKFVLIFRDPVSNIEGLRRKWPDVFGQADLADVCDFWESVHKIFLEDTEAFASDVIVVSYSKLTEDADVVLEELAQFCGLQPREKPLTYRDRPNIPGKGLRNVINGEIKVVQNIDSQVTSSLSPEQWNYINNRLLPAYDKLNQLSKSTCPHHSPLI